MRGVNGRNYLEPRQRALTAAEMRMLRTQAATLRGSGRRAVAKGPWIGVAAIALLWALTMLASDAPALAITGFWIVAGGAIILWVLRDLRGDSKTLEAVAAGIESAVIRNVAEVYDIRSEGFVEFDEIEDEGACYAFQLPGKRLVFLQGQEFYRAARFPSLDFSLVFPLDEAGRRVEMLVEKRAAEAKPQRRVPAGVKRTLEFPENLEVIDGTLDELEERLRH